LPYDQGVTSLQCQVLFRIRFALEYAFEVDCNDPEAAFVALASNVISDFFPESDTPPEADGTYGRRFGHHDDAGRATSPSTPILALCAASNSTLTTGFRMYHLK
jgi:hypothetical protein